MNAKPYKIGIGVRYGNDLFTLAFVIFKPNGDVVLSQHHGDYNKLDDGTKWNPHITYHASGRLNFAAHKGNRVDGGYSRVEQREPLVPEFKGPQFFPNH